MSLRAGDRCALAPRDPVRCSAMCLPVSKSALDGVSMAR